MRADFAFADGVALVRREGRTYVLPLGAEVPSALDEVGTHCLEMLTDEPFDQAVGLLAEAYEQQESQMRTDLALFADQMVSLGVLVGCARTRPGADR